MEVDQLYPQTAVAASAATYDNRSMLVSSQDSPRGQQSQQKTVSPTLARTPPSTYGSEAGLLTSTSTSTSTAASSTSSSSAAAISASAAAAVATTTTTGDHDYGSSDSKTLAQMSVLEQEAVRSSTVSELLKNAVRGAAKQPVKPQVTPKPPSKNEFELKIHSDGKVLKVQKSRQRKIHSCIYCHLKKIKCSRVQPTCNHCEKLGLECKYFANERVSRGGTNVNPTATGANGIDVNDDYSASGAAHGKRPLSPRVSPNPKHRHIKHEDDDSAIAAFPTSPSPILDANNIISPPLPPPSHSGSKKNSMSNINDQGISSSSKLHTSSDAVGRPPPPPLPLASARLVMSAMSSPLDFPIFDQTPSTTNASLNANSNAPFNNALLSGISPGPGISTPTNGLTNFLLQTPIINNMSNNITNSFFNNGNSNVNANTNMNPSNPNYNNPPTGISNFGEEQYSFNLLSFTFKNEIKNSNAGATGISNTSNPNVITSNQQSMNLNPYLSNPATTINYLYGTNTYYDNDHLLEDLENHLPVSRERSHELIERYINSVHILLPILINLDDFVAQHEFYWNIRTRNSASANSSPNNNSPPENGGTETNDCNGNSSSSGSTNGNFANPSAPSSTSSSSNSQPDFNYLQFYTLYFPILYASTISEFEEYDNLLLNQDINKYLKAFNKICQYYNYPHGIKILPLLLGNVIIQSTSPNPSTMEMSQIIRYAKFLQMHKDPVLTLRITDWEVVKFRRLLWWVIFGLDALTSHNFCLPPVCQFNDFNVLMPDELEPIFGEHNKEQIVEKRLNITMMSMNIKFKYDRILSDLVYQLHNGLSSDITPAKVTEIKSMIIELFKDINNAMHRLNSFIKQHPPQTVQEMNLINFVKNHSWSFVDRATMLLHKKILMGDVKKVDTFSPYALTVTTSVSGASNSNAQGKSSTESPNNGPHSEGLLSNRSYSFGQDGVISSTSHKTRGGVLSLSQYEDTFGKIQEANIVANFHNLSISQLKFSQFENFTYDNLNNNLIPSILHNLNDFLKYNDFIKFGKFNWYVKRTIPLDSIILMFIIIIVKFKYEFITVNELIVYVKLINKALFILIRKWFKNEKYKRMLSLTNLAWDYILKKYNIINIVNQYIDKFGGEDESKVEYFDYELTKFVNLNDLFSIMDVPLPIFPDDLPYKLANGSYNVGSQVTMDSSGNNQFHANQSQNGTWPSITMAQASSQGSNGSTNDTIEIHTKKHMPNALITREDTHIPKDVKLEVMQLNEKIYYDLRNNFVDINDYCAFYSSLENILHALMDYINNDS